MNIPKPTQITGWRDSTGRTHSSEADAQRENIKIALGSLFWPINTLLDQPRVPKLGNVQSDDLADWLTQHAKSLLPYLQAWIDATPEEQEHRYYEPVS